MKYLPSGKMASKINRLSCRKKLLLVNRKKQKNFYWLGELSTENSIANGSALGTGRPFSRGGR